jgi:putative ABC transport system permease protein
MLFKLATHSLWNRRATAILIVASVAISVALLLTVRQLNTQARMAFTNTVSDTDLIVGARSAQINLLLYSVFRLGDATNDVSWLTFERLAKHRDVAWAIPLSLGDSHRGFRVLGTNDAYFQHYRFGSKQPLTFVAGHPMTDLHDVVIGAEVARQLDYQLGDEVVIAHGIGTTSFVQHADQPFTIAGILRPTGTPVDRTVHVSLEAIEAIHLDGPKTITAMLIGLKSKLATFRMQRAINEYEGEPLLAILPGVALQQLWSIVGVVEKALTAVGAVVVVAALLCLLTAVLTGLNERRREMAILRSTGARPAHVFVLLMSEAGLLAVLGIAGGLLMSYGAMALAIPILRDRFGLLLELGVPSASDFSVLLLIAVAALLVSAIPAWQAYRRTLADGLTMRV